MLLKLHHSSSFKLPSPPRAQASHTISQYLNINPTTASTTRNSSLSNLKQEAGSSHVWLESYSQASRALLNDWPLMPPEDTTQFVVDTDTDEDAGVLTRESVLELTELKLEEEEEESNSTVSVESNLASMIYDSSKPVGDEALTVDRSESIRLEEKRAENVSG